MEDPFKFNEHHTYLNLPHLYYLVIHLASGEVHLELLHQYFDVLFGELVALQINGAIESLNIYLNWNHQNAQCLQ